MHPSQGLLSLCCIAALCCLAQTASEQIEQKARQKDLTKNTDSDIFKIKRFEKEQRARKIKSTKNENNFKSIPITHPTLLRSTEKTTAEVHRKPTKNKKNKNAHGLNKKLLNKLGFTKVKAPNSHNRKRLAIESRRHASPDDSHMFIIKLPPNAHYYSSPKAKGDAANRAVSSQNSLSPHGEATEKEKKTSSSAVPMDNGKEVSFPFNSNGRPGRIYHWNLPVLQKILEDKERFAHVPNAMKQQLIDIKDTPTWSKPWENETIEKSYGKANTMHYYKKPLKRKSPTYYAPASSVNKNSFHKYFAGNGKPKGFFVIKENQKNPLYYKNIVS